MAIEVVECIGPAWAASYLINGDASGITDEEEAQVDAWLARQECDIVGVMEDEPWFSNSAHIHFPEGNYRGGDMLTYIGHRRTP